MDDCISRAAVVDALEKVAELFPWKVPGNRDSYDRYNEAWNDAIGRAEIEIEKLPSAQPDHIGEVTEMVGDVISRQAAIDALAEWHDVAITNRLNNLPSAQRWIPCDRELPKPNEEDGNGFYKAYLVQDGRWMDVARWDGKYWIAWGYSTVLLNVVAWMPLPEPWKGDTP